MAYFDPSFETESPLRRALGAMVSRLTETPFDARQRRLAARVTELRALSDDQLATMGLTRSDILFHVFGSRR